VCERAGCLCACRELGANGTKSMLAVPVSFVSEHIETLEEIDMGECAGGKALCCVQGGPVPALRRGRVDFSRPLLAHRLQTGLQRMPSGVGVGSQ